MIVFAKSSLSGAKGSLGYVSSHVIATAAGGVAATQTGHISWKPYAYYMNTYLLIRESRSTTEHETKSSTCIPS